MPLPTVNNLADAKKWFDERPENSTAELMLFSPKGDQRVVADCFAQAKLFYGKFETPPRVDVGEPPLDRPPLPPMPVPPEKPPREEQPKIGWTDAQKTAIRAIGAIASEHFESSIFVPLTQPIDKVEIWELFHHGGYVVAYGLVELARQRLDEKRLIAYGPKEQSPESE